MIVSNQYLERFAVPISEPVTLPLNGWEIDGGPSITVDDDDGHAISYVHWDEWPSYQQWDIKEGTEKRWTLVTITQNGAIVGDHAYEFSGLITPDDLRAWYRAKLGIIEPVDGDQETQS